MKEITRLLFSCIVGVLSGVVPGLAAIVTLPPRQVPAPTLTVTDTHSCWVTTTYTQPKPTSTVTNPTWAQCGGFSFPGPFLCEPGDHCQSLGPYYSQCQPDDESTKTYPDPTTVTRCA